MNGFTEFLYWLIAWLLFDDMEPVPYEGDDEISF